MIYISNLAVSKKTLPRVLILSLTIFLITSSFSFASQVTVGFSCPGILLNPSKTLVLYYVNVSNQINGYNSCASAALRFYNQSNIIKNYNISINLKNISYSLNSSLESNSSTALQSLIKRKRINNYTNTNLRNLGQIETKPVTFQVINAASSTNESYANWAGYAVTSDNCSSSCESSPKTITMVNGSWIVQTALPTNGPTYSSQWVGIGGLQGYDGSLIQIGTESDYYNGSAHYYAWYEDITNPLLSQQVEIPGFTVKPGYIIYANVVCISNCSTSSQIWSLYIKSTNSSGYEELSIPPFSYSSSEQSAEWIDERTMEHGVFPNLTDFGTAFYDQDYTFIPNTGYATVSSTTEPIGHFNHTSISMFTTNAIILLAHPSLLTSDGTSWTSVATFNGLSGTNTTKLNITNSIFSNPDVFLRAEYNFQ